MESASALDRASGFPMLRYMGSKARLVPWLHEVFSGIEFATALDPFSGSGCVAYLLKSMGKSVHAGDTLLFPTVIAQATIANQTTTLTADDLALLTAKRTGRGSRSPGFIEATFKGIFNTTDDLRFLDTVWANLAQLADENKKALALAALIRSCAKRQPRGVFTVADPTKYLDSRRDLQLSIREHFTEQIAIYNSVVFDSGTECSATRGDVLTADHPAVDLVYLDPPYVPRSDDNCYVKRYHFLEGLASGWLDPQASIMAESKVKKIAKRYTPFSYRRTAPEAFDTLFKVFKDSTIVLSYSSNGFPDLAVLEQILRRYKGSVEVESKSHRYHFGTHTGVSDERTKVTEYLIVGTD